MKHFRKVKGKYRGYTKKWKDMLIKSAMLGNGGNYDDAFASVTELEKLEMDKRNIELHGGIIRVITAEGYIVHWYGKRCTTFVPKGR